MLKGVILAIAPDASIVDLTHEVPPQDIAAGAYLLRSAIDHFPRGTIHVAVVDPGVGTARRALLIETRDAFFIGPDNGLLSSAIGRTPVRIVDISRSPYRAKRVSQTFHGRDVFAPVAARLATGVPMERLGRPVRTMRRVSAARPRKRGGALHGRIIWVDHFGNLISDVTKDDLARLRSGFRSRGLSVRIADRAVRLRRSYAGVPRGAALALVNSADALEIAVNQGSAATILGMRRGAAITVVSG